MHAFIKFSTVQKKKTNVYLQYPQKSIEVQSSSNNGLKKMDTSLFDKIVSRIHKT